jgi:alkaline phosphatase
MRPALRHQCSHAGQLQQSCFRQVPSLADMAGQSNRVASKNNPKGFFLMVESASVDKEAHARRACGHIGEMEQLDEVVAMVRDYAGDKPGTLLVVTADHGHAVQVLNEGSFAAYWVPMGWLASIRSDGSVLRIATQPAVTAGRTHGHRAGKCTGLRCS